MRNLILGLGVAVALVGCALQRLHIAAFDGRPIDPVSQEQAMLECRGKATAASAAVPYAYGSSGGLARALEQDYTQKAAFQGCMAEKGMRATWVPVETASIQ